jgi:GalNAc5-diNAcBac-PP-undecaprenol beta-1,3-glucosyltransferase
MSVAATVLIPTHDHGPTLLRSVPSVLAQTVEELEVFVIGDGVPDVTREIMAELGSDERVTFFDHPKGPRHGEVYRHEALRGARGEIVCYLSDDDLWLPGHIAQVQALLADADFAHARPLWIETDGRPRPWLVDLCRPFYRELLISGQNRVPLGSAGHTLELYRRLPAGWRTTPAEIPTDLYMWQQILSVPGCRAVSGSGVTYLHFPSPARKEWSTEERFAELDTWASRLADPGLPGELSARLLDALTEDAAALEEGEAGLWSRIGDLDRDRAELAAQLHEVDGDRAQLSRRLDELSRRVDELSSSVTWRIRARVLAVPVLRPLLRSAARALAGRAAPGAAGSPHHAPTPEPRSPATQSPTPDRPSDS